MRRPALRTYLEEARRWDQDRLAAALASRRRALVAAGASSLLAITAVTALALLTPLKTVEAFVVRVDRSTGQVEAVSGVSALEGPVRYEEAISRYFIAAYVRAREAYLPAAAETAYRTVALMSAPDEQRRFAALWRGSNPDSPQNQLGQNGQADVEIRSISFVAPDVAQVRFERRTRMTSGEQRETFLATLAFAYSAAPMREADRLANPLGFQVTTYRLDPEIIP